MFIGRTARVFSRDHFLAKVIFIKGCVAAKKYWTGQRSIKARMIYVVKNAQKYFWGYKSMPSFPILARSLPEKKSGCSTEYKLV